MDAIPSRERLTGAEKASIMMLALSEVDVARLFALLDHHEVMEISQTMAVIGRVDAAMVEELLHTFQPRFAARAEPPAQYVLRDHRRSDRLEVYASAPTLRPRC